MTYESNLRLSGCDPITMVNVLEGLNVDVLGVNCSLGPVELTPIINDILKVATVLLIKSNASITYIEGKTCYNIDIDTFVSKSIEHVKNGVKSLVAIGTTPELVEIKQYT